MKVLLYNELDPNKISGFAKMRRALEAGNFSQAGIKKLGDNLYRAKLNRSDRLLFSLYEYNNETYCLLLEYLPGHDYQSSRFLHRGVGIDENKIPDMTSLQSVTPEPLTYVNPDHSQFNLLDKIISFDEEQQRVYRLPPPLIIIGSAGSGKTALILEKMKQAAGEVLYVSRSSFLVESARGLYYSHNYSNEAQEVTFLSFREFMESIQVPQGEEMTPARFDDWFEKYRGKSRLKDSHKLFEEFRGVLTGQVTDQAWLSREQYLQLGVKQSIYNEEERAGVYELFEKYLDFMEKSQLYDPNILSHRYLAKTAPRYDFIVVDEVQDLTSIQLFLILKTLREQGHFILSGDSNQIVHPNFFSWSKLKTLFFQQQEITGHREMMRILHTNYRNSPVITHIANRILKLKSARFGSIDKESNYLVKSVGEQRGRLQLLQNNAKVKQELDSKTARSAKFAVLVMHPEQKKEAARWFNTPLIFSVQEAKGLEYENIILYNFIGSEETVFRDIARGVDASELEKDTLTFSRTKDKRDKSLEIYKFFINGLYVAVTRAVTNLYVLEDNQKNPVIQLLELADYSGEVAIEKQDSSVDEWQKEARKLELQGKQEQADGIRQRILQQKPVPWPVLDRTAAKVLEEEAFAAKNRKKLILLMEYSFVYHTLPLLQKLRDAGMKAAIPEQDAKAMQQLSRKHYMPYELRNTGAVIRDVEKYGIDHRTIFNLTPLMVATRVGNATLVEELTGRGADGQMRGSNGLNAIQMALEQGLTDKKYAEKKLPEIYPFLAGASLSVQADGRLIKLDDHLMGLFLLNLMFALFYRVMGESVCENNGFTAKMLAETVQILPDSVLPARRKKQSYISSILSGNEVDKDSPYNRKLFRRIRRGHYIINPALKIKQGDQWGHVHDFLLAEDLGFKLHIEQHNKEYLHFPWLKKAHEQLDASRHKNLHTYCAMVNRIKSGNEHVIKTEIPLDSTEAKKQEEV